MAQMEEWRREYPEAFAREYDPASGLRFNGWVEGGEVVMAKKVFVIDIAKCNGCHTCQIVCKDEHVANDWTPIAKPQPEIGQFWLELTERVRGTVPKVKVAYRPHLCMHCDKAPCMESCPVEGALYKRDDGLVIIDAGQVHRLQELRGCLSLRRHLLQRRPQHRPEVHRLCPSPRRRLERAPLRRCLPDPGHQVPGRRLRPRNSSAKAEVWKPELKTRPKPRVYYLNLPKKFIAGTVYDPVEEEVIIGATCTLKPAAGAKPRPSRPTTTATSGSKACPTAPSTWRSRTGSKVQGLHRSRYRRKRISTWEISLLS